MKFIKTNIPDLTIVEPTVFGDNRGYFFESFRQDKFDEFSGGNVKFIQDNQSMSAKEIVRGLHFQQPPYAQGKLVRVIKGSVLDVVVDIRKSSPTYGESFSLIISEEKKNMLWIPAGFAHGFLSLEDNTIFSYRCTNYYNKESEGCIAWNDPVLAIDWGIENPLVSEKDQQGTAFTDFVSPFK